MYVNKVSGPGKACRLIIDNKVERAKSDTKVILSTFEILLKFFLS